MTATQDRSQIKFIFRQNHFEDKQHAIQKADDHGRKRMYLAGVSSGLDVDAHGERMTEKAINSFMAQANQGEILLYPDIHGIQASQDIGKLVKAEVLGNGDWYTEYRLYDEFDDVDDISTQKAKKIWKQMNGLPPYDRPMQKGFSIEGFIPDGGIIGGVDKGGYVEQKVIDDVELEGVVLVGKPAYQTGIANAVYKALGEVAPWQADNVKKSIGGELRQMMTEEAVRDEYYKQRWTLNDALERTIEKIMKFNNPAKRQELEIAFDEYKNLMTELILRSEALFLKEESEVEHISSPYGEVNKGSESELLKALATGLRDLRKQFNQEVKKK